MARGAHVHDVSDTPLVHSRLPGIRDDGGHHQQRLLCLSGLRACHAIEILGTPIQGGARWQPSKMAASEPSVST